jgi:hypothetical protein
MKKGNKIDYTELITANKKELLVLLEQMISLIYGKFQKASIYSKILYIEKHQDEKNIKAFNYNEQIILQKKINDYFSPFIEHLKRCCPDLTPKEIFICCLAVSFSQMTISLSMGYHNTDSVKTHKCRIKKKMVELTSNQFLFDVVFTRYGLKL